MSSRGFTQPAYEKLMTVVLELKSEIEARLIVLAAARGISVEEYIQNYLESLASLNEESSYNSTTAEQWVEEILRVAGHR